jgi:hypothetical protein
VVNLLPPRVAAPVSECSRFIRVRGQFPGATTEVVDTTSNAVVASGTATGADHDLLVSGTLTPGRDLAASQILGADNSGLAADTVDVQQRPNPVGPPVFAAPVFRCARCLYLEGVVPGADVEVRQGGAVIGTAHSVDGVARIGLSQAIGTGGVEAQQTACGISSAPMPTGPLPPAAGDRQGRILPPPEVGYPLVHCSSRVTVSGVYPGATVELDRSAGPDLVACFDLPSLWFGVFPPLGVGETVRARQRYPDCEQESLWSDPPVVVDPLEPVPSPTVQAPLCAGSTNVTLCGLKADARIRITVAPHTHHGGFPQGGTVYEAVAPTDGCFDFAFVAPGLPVDSAVYATQEMCGGESAPSNVVLVDPAPAALPTPVVPEPLFECATVVHVENLHPGTRVYVVSVTLGGLGEAQVFGTEADIAVAPALVADDSVFAYATGCGLRSSDSAHVPVQRSDELSPPRVVEPLFSCERTVTVVDVVPGAWVDVYVGGLWRGRAKAGTGEVEVPIVVGVLGEGDIVTARQSLCERVSEFGNEVRVTRFDGRWERIGGDDKSEILAVHAALVLSGHIVIFAGDQYDDAARLPNPPDVDHTRVMETAPPYAVRAVTGLPPNANLFCCGHAMLEDGSVLTGSGTERAPTLGFHGRHWFGPRESWRFVGDQAGSEHWEELGKLNRARPGDVRPGFDPENSGGRWYPTLITLPDGRVLALGGHPLEGDSRHTNTSLEVYDPVTKAWTLVGAVDYPNIPGRSEVPERINHSEYPRAHVLRDGTVFVASEMADGAVHKWTPSADPLAWTRVADGPPAGYRGNPQPYTTVLLPLHHTQEYAPTVLICGRQAAYTIQPLAAIAPAWTPTAGRTMPGMPIRQYPLATLLPSGEVFVSGGTTSGRDADALLAAEMFDPVANQWRVLPEASRVRNYHSTALLMPNGAVWHSGSNEDCLPGPASRDLTVEVYEPWYFCWERPRISGATSRVCPGETLNIETPDADVVTEVVLIRCGSFTHAFNPDQRLVSLPFRRSPEVSTLLTASVPGNAVLVPGYYLLFVRTADRVPSEGRFVQVCRRPGIRIGGLRPDWWTRIIAMADLLGVDPSHLDGLQRALEERDRVDEGGPAPQRGEPARGEDVDPPGGHHDRNGPAGPQEHGPHVHR